MRDIWFISDTHFGHEKIIPHENRPFSSADHMDEFMMASWNDRVKEDDLIYHLGDVTWRHTWLPNLDKLNGTKRLILGNHDSGKKCAPYFQKIQLFRRFSEFGFMVSHMPINKTERREPISVHGHTHGRDVDDPMNINISVEKTNYAPIHLDELIFMLPKKD